MAEEVENLQQFIENALDLKLKVRSLPALYLLLLLLL